MTRIIIESSEKQNVQPIIEAALASERQRLEIGLKRTRERLKQFESRYRMTTEEFAQKGVAEDLSGGD